MKAHQLFNTSPFQDLFQDIKMNKIILHEILSLSMGRQSYPLGCHEMPSWKWHIGANTLLQQKGNLALIFHSQGYGWGHMGVQYTSGGNSTKNIFCEARCITFNYFHFQCDIFLVDQFFFLFKVLPKIIEWSTSGFQDG